LILQDQIKGSKANENQQEAIVTTDGPLLIIAGPGSGKTMTLVERLVYLVIKGIKPENILIATFTEKAAKELITRVSNRLLEIDLKVNLNEMYIGTLHSIFLRILEENREFTRLKRNYRLLDDFDQKYFLFRNINPYLKVENAEVLLGDHKVNRWEKAKNLIYYLNKVGEECLDLEALKKSDEPAIVAIGKFYEIYLGQLLEENALDFSTIQAETLFLLEKQHEILKKLQDSISHLMIDEYQDTNTIQEKIILLLSGEKKNLCVVGDDDQGLYRFRGATIRNILEFPQNFQKGHCRQINLTTNYRSHPGIIQFYNEWMQRCDWTSNGKTFRFDKTIKPRDFKFPEYPSVIKVGREGNWEEYYEEVYQFIIHLQSQGVLKDLNQIAFLFKSVKNDNVIGLANYLEGKGISVFSPRSALFFEREEIQLLLGAFVFIFPNLFEELKWNDAATLPVWTEYQSWKTKFANELRKNPEQHKGLLQWCQKRAKEHLTLTGRTTYAFAALLYQLLEFPMFADFLNVDLHGKKTTLRAAYNFALLSKLLYKFEYLYNITVFTPKNLKKILQDLFNTYLRFIVDGGIEEFEDFDEHAPAGCVSFMTIHQSKGLEFPIVLVDSLNLVPSKQHDDVDVILQNQFYVKPPFEPMDKTKIYDFWRLYYTAFSRPQNLLVLTTREHDGKGMGKYPSKYFEPVYSKLVSWRDPKFNIGNVSLSEIKATNIKHEYSFTSHILLYESCPLQYKFYKELGFTEVRTGGVLGGSLLHQTIEDIHKAVLRGQVNLLTDSNISDWFNSNYYLLSKQQRAYLHQSQIESLLKQILRYRDNNQHQWDRIKEAEVDVSLVKEDYILKGTIDLIKGEDDTVELIDFKSGDKPDINSQEPTVRRQLQQYRRQLEVYAHLVEERTGHKVSRINLYYPKEENGTPYISFPANKDFISNTVKSFDEVVEKIESKNYELGHIVKSEKQCSGCDMRYYCNPKQYSN
jgi:DNA helicase-2/ATP-dependent DNA helicase PcrA